MPQLRPGKWPARQLLSCPRSPTRLLQPHLQKKLLQLHSLMQACRVPRWLHSCLLSQPPCPPSQRKSRPGRPTQQRAHALSPTS